MCYDLITTAGELGRMFMPYIALVVDCQVLTVAHLPSTMLFRLGFMLANSFVFLFVPDAS